MFSKEHPSLSYTPACNPVTTKKGTWIDETDGQGIDLLDRIC